MRSSNADRGRERLPAGGPTPSRPRGAFLRGRLRLREERGQVLVLTVLAMTAMIGMVGLALDVVHAYVEQQIVQSAASSAALAGADDLPGTAATAIADATRYVQLNLSGSGGGTTAVDVFSPPQQSKSHNGDSNSVEVLITRTVPTFFLGVLDIGSLTVTGHAVATSDAVSPCALCLVGPSGQTLVSNGNDHVTVSGAGVVIDSNSSQAAVLNGNATVASSHVGIVGGDVVTGDGGFSTEPQTGAAPVPDPLSGVEPPALDGPEEGDVTVDGSADVTLRPGIYGDITDNGDNTLTLAPGTYVITGGLTLNGNDQLKGAGVTLYLTCSAYSASDPAPCAGQPGAAVTLGGNVGFDLSPPASGAYAGLTLFSDRGNTAPLTLNGNVGLLAGTVYARSGDVVLNGNVTSSLTLDSLIVANAMTLDGNGQIVVDYQPSQNYEALGSSHLTE